MGVSSSVPQERENFYRSCSILLDLCSRALREILSVYVPPDKCPITINFRLKITQKYTLKDISTKRTYDECDISLLYILFRTIIPASVGFKPTKGWGTTPILAASLSCADDIERIRLRRNELGHSTDNRIDNATYFIVVSEVKDIMKRMDGRYNGTINVPSAGNFVADLNNLLNCALDSNLYKFQAELATLRKDIGNVEDELDRSRVAQDKLTKKHDALEKKHDHTLNRQNRLETKHNKMINRQDTLEKKQDKAKEGHDEIFGVITNINHAVTNVQELLHRQTSGQDTETTPLVKNQRLPPSEVNQCGKYILFLSNILFWIAGIAMVTCGGYMYADRALITFIRIGSALSWFMDPANLLILFGAVVFILAFLGCFGSCQEKDVLLKIYQYTIILILLLETGLGIYVYFNSHAVKGTVEEVLMMVIPKYREHDDYESVIDLFQERWKCCGVRDYNDWEENIYFNCTATTKERCGVPHSCCQHFNKAELNKTCGYMIRNASMEDIMATIHINGCFEIFIEYVKNHSPLVYGSIAAIVFLQLLTIWLTYKMRNGMRRQKKKEDLALVTAAAMQVATAVPVPSLF